MKLIQRWVLLASAIIPLALSGCAGLGAAAAVGAVVYFKSSSHEVATVNLDAQPDKVYAAALKTVEESATATIASQDPKKGLIEVTQDKKKVTLKITALNSKLTQLTVTSDIGKDQPGSTKAVLNRVNQICDQMGVSHYVVK